MCCNPKVVLRNTNPTGARSQRRRWHTDRALPLTGWRVCLGGKGRALQQRKEEQKETYEVMKQNVWKANPPLTYFSAYYMSANCSRHLWGINEQKRQREWSRLVSSWRRWELLMWISGERGSPAEDRTGAKTRRPRPT